MSNCCSTLVTTSCTFKTQVLGTRDSLIWDRLWCGWFCCRRIVPSLPSLVRFRRSLPPGVTGRAAVAHGRQGGGRFRSPEKKKEASKSSWPMAAERWGRTWRVQRTSALAYRRGQRRDTLHTAKLCPFLFLVFPPSFHSAFSSVLFGGLCCEWKTRRLIHFPYLHLLFVQLQVTMPGKTPLWRLLVSCTCLQL